MKKYIVLILLCVAFFDLAVSIPPDFDYDFIGFRQLAKLLPTNCDNITGQVYSRLGGIQKPTHDYEHIQCEADENMGTRIKFVIHRDIDDDAVTGDPTRERIEMYTGKRTDLHAAKGTTSIFAWWFFISSSIVTGPRFWHIFQMKPSGDGADSSPTLTFSMNNEIGLHYQFFQDHDGITQFIPMLTLNEAKGKWIQAYVKVHHTEVGYADFYLKDFDGVQLYHEKITGNFWWDNTEYYYPKWGLYRRKDDIFNDSDFAYFQNVQIWRD